MDPRPSQRVGAHLRSNVVGYIALFAALTLGTAWAAKTAPKNTVTSKSIVNDSVTGKDVKESTLTGVPGANGGTVTQVGTGSGLSGGPITGSGTISLNSCPADQVLKSTGGGYACANDVDTDTDTNSGGDITGVTAGNGLAGGGTSGGVSLSLMSCPDFQVLMAATSVGSGWLCVTANYARRQAIGVGLATPDVSGTSLVVLSYPAPQPITDLILGVDGQTVTLKTTNGFASIVDGGNFSLSSNWTPFADDTLTLINDQGVWTEVARSDN